MFSSAAMDRILEKEMASNAKLREEVAGRPLRSQGEQFTDEELIARLHSFGIDLDRTSLGRLCDECLSAEEIAGPLIARRAFETRQEKLQGD